MGSDSGCFPGEGNSAVLVPALLAPAQRGVGGVPSSPRLPGPLLPERLSLPHAAALFAVLGLWHGLSLPLPKPYKT